MAPSVSWTTLAGAPNWSDKGNDLLSDVAREVTRRKGKRSEAMEEVSVARATNPRLRYLRGQPGRELLLHGRGGRPDGRRRTSSSRAHALPCAAASSLAAPPHGGLRLPSDPATPRSPRPRLHL
ncbi:hypothetical protein ZWY2020_013644 [Hordeum vulgare]|nr:hypothetical protein ZWY2020_013644 [Hordeum vulgare]